MSTTATPIANPALSAPPRRVLRTRRALRRLVAAIAEARAAVAEARRLSPAAVAEACGPGFNVAGVLDDADYLLGTVLPGAGFNLEGVACWLDTLVPSEAIAD